MATLRRSSRLIDLDDAGEYQPDAPRPAETFHQVPTVFAGVPNQWPAGRPLAPAYIIVFDTDGNPLYKCGLNRPGESLTLWPGESLTIEATMIVL